MSTSLTKLLVPLLLGMTLICGSPVFAQSKAIITIPSEVRVESDSIILGDIAAISGADEKTASRLRQIPLGLSPGIGTVAEFTASRISLSVSAAGFENSNFSLRAPSKILIRRASQPVNRDELKAEIIRAVTSTLETTGIKVNFTGFEIPAIQDTPTGKTKITARIENTLILSARIPVSIEIKIDGKTYQRFSAVVNIEAEAEILVAARDLVRGDKISPADLKAENHRLEKPLRSYIRDAGRLRGTVLQKNISAGEAISTDSVASGYVIRAGDQVKVIARDGKMSITVTGEARASGRIGDRIAVKNSQSGAILQAIVEDEGLVKINF